MLTFPRPISSAASGSEYIARRENEILTEDTRNPILVKTSHPRNPLQLVVLERRPCNERRLLERRLRILRLPLVLPLTTLLVRFDAFRIALVLRVGCNACPFSLVPHRRLGFGGGGLGFLRPGALSADFVHLLLQEPDVRRRLLQEGFELGHAFFGFLSFAGVVMRQRLRYKLGKRG